MDTALSINFLPNAIYSPGMCIRTTFEAAQESGFPSRNLIFEITEGERIENHDHLREIMHAYQAFGFLTAIDDFGAGWAGLNLLAEFQPDLVKIDMALTRNIHLDRVRQAIVRATQHVCADLDIDVIAEGIESADEARCLHGFGIRLFLGYYFARPAIGQLPVPTREALAAIA